MLEIPEDERIMDLDEGTCSWHMEHVPLVVTARNGKEGKDEDGCDSA